MAEIYHGSITSYDPNTGQYYVRLRGSNLDTLTGVSAHTLSPTPYEDGSGIKSAPIAPVDSQCLIYKSGNRHYILGFISPHGPIAHGDVKPVRDIQPGDIFLTHSTPSKIGITQNGTILHEAGKWASLAINPITQQLTAWFRNWRLNLYSMIIEYFADLDAKTSLAQIKMAKWVPTTSQSLPPPDGSPATTPDHFTLRAGVLDDTHIIELLISQKDIGAGPQHTSTTQLGTQDDGTYFNHVASTSTAGSSINLTAEAKDDGTVHIRVDNNNGNYVDALADTGAGSYLMDVNGKAKIGIDTNGNVTISALPTDANIILGGTGNEQRLVTETFLTQYYNNHIHPNGNQGAPTGPPLSPLITPSSSDLSSNTTTNTTKAE